MLDKIRMFARSLPLGEPKYMPETVITWVETLVHDPVMLAVALALSTFLTEDGTLIAGSLLVGSGMAPAPLVITAIALGITLGDIGLYGLGSLARKSRFLRSRLPLRRAASLKKWLNGKRTPVLFFSRFLPGTRLPTYLTFGFLRLPLLHFSLVMAAASAIWVTLMVLFVSETQKAFAGLGTIPAIGTALLAAFLVMVLARRLAKRSHIAKPSQAGGSGTDTDTGKISAGEAALRAHDAN